MKRLLMGALCATVVLISASFPPPAATAATATFMTAANPSGSDMCLDPSGSPTFCVMAADGSTRTTGLLDARADIRLPGGWRIGEFALDEAFELRGPDLEIWWRCYMPAMGTSFCGLGTNGFFHMIIDSSNITMKKPIAVEASSEVSCPSEFSSLSPDKCFKIKAADGHYYAIPGVQL